MSRPYCQLTFNGLRFLGKRSKEEALKKHFNKWNWLSLPSFLHPELYQFVMEEMSRAQFFVKYDSDIACELMMKQNPALRALQFLFCDPELFAFIRRVTGCAEIGNYDGRVYRFEPGKKFYDSWHDDISKRGRMVAMGVNLSRHVYEGGLLQIRHKKTKKMYGCLAYNAPGQAAMFRLAPELEHRVKTPTKFDRTVFVGWFEKHTDGFMSPARGIPSRIQDPRKASAPVLKVRHSSETLVYNPSSTYAFRLNPTAAEIFERYEKGVPISRIASELSSRHWISKRRAKRDVESVVNKINRYPILRH